MAIVSPSFRGSNPKLDYTKRITSPAAMESSLRKKKSALPKHMG